MQIVELFYNNLNFKSSFWDNTSEKGNILICPAMGITAQYYAYLASWLYEQGYTVMVLDYQGTGLSGSENVRNIHVTLQDWTKNIEIAGQWLQQKNPKVPMFFIGHSLGSQLFGFIETIELFDRVIFIASSTGYWKDGHSPQKWINYFLLHVILPLSNLIWGFTNAKFFRQGENYPKGPALQWRQWCLNKDYLQIELNDQQQNNFNLFERKITSLWFTDDPIANKITVPQLTGLYKKAITEFVKVAPGDYQLAKIGHTGFLSRTMKDTIWKKILDIISA